MQCKLRAQANAQKDRCAWARTAACGLCPFLSQNTVLRAPQRQPSPRCRCLHQRGQVNLLQAYQLAACNTQYAFTVWLTFHSADQSKPERLKTALDTQHRTAGGQAVTASQRMQRARVPPRFPGPPSTFLRGWTCPGSSAVSSWLGQALEAAGVGARVRSLASRKCAGCSSSRLRAALSLPSSTSEARGKLRSHTTPAGGRQLGNL